VAPVLIPIAAVVLGGAFAPSCEAPFAPRARDRAAAPSLAGLPGLFEVPAAISAPDRSAALAFNGIRTSSTPGQSQQRNGFVSFGFIPRLTLVARGSVMDNDLNMGMRDISATAQVLLAREGRWTPSLAVGAQDIGGAAPNFEARYAVASKTFGGRARLTAGFGSGLGKAAYSLDGPFGGIEIAPCSWLHLIAENEGQRRNFGVRLAPLGDWGVRAGVEPTFDLLWREGQGRMAGVGLRVQTGAPFHRPDSARAPAPARPSTFPETGPGSLSDALVRYGFENVRVTAARDTLVISYENRVFNRDEWDALGIVMAEAVRHARNANVMRITIHRLDLPVMQVISGMAAFGRFVDGSLDASAFAQQLAVTYPSQGQEGRAANPSRFHLDLTVRPRVDALVLTEISVAESRLSLLPEARLQLARGLSMTGRRAIVVQKSRDFPDGHSNPNADQILLHAARNGLPFAPGIPGLISQLSVGRFGPEEVGAAAQFDAVLKGGGISLGGVAALFGDEVMKPRRSVALGSIRIRHAPMDLSFSLTAGRFLHGDVGAAGEVERRFGPSEVAMFVQSTDIATMVGARVSIPLSGTRDLRPGPVRARLPEYGDFSKWTQVLKDINAVRTDVARPLETGQDLARIVRGRDRLNEARLRRDLEALRESALRWSGR
jgi:hypothetical protein